MHSDIFAAVDASQFLTGVVAVCVAVLIPLVKEFWKDRRERRSDELSQSYLKSIADSNGLLAQGQGHLNVLLETSVAVNSERHAQNLEAMKHVCKCHDCGNYEAPGKNFGQGNKGQGNQPTQ